jgi:DNA gyrase subunit B
MEIARKYQLAQAVISRLSNWMDGEALHAIMNGVSLNLDTLADAEKSATALQAGLHAATVAAVFDARTDKHVLTITRRVHGNDKLSTITADFVHGGDYAALVDAALTFQGLVTDGALVQRGEGDKLKEQKVADFREAMQWLIGEAERTTSRQRYKGLGEETTMDPTVRRLLRVQIEDAIEADRVFTTLMGDEVEPRRAFIESNALRAMNIDV